KYDWSDERLPVARAWNLDRFRAALAAGVSPIVVDRGNGLNPETLEYALLAREHGYRIELKEADSPWWREIRTLLRDPTANSTALDLWAIKLAELRRQRHRVPAERIRAWMRKWKVDLTVEEILALAR